MKQTKQLAFVGATAFVLFAFTWVVFGAVATQHELKQPTWEAPTIPKCDKELWLRIKDGCK